MSDTKTYVGIAVCPWCNSRYRARAQTASIQGKSARCIRCHRDFEIKIIEPSRVEQAAMARATADEPRRKRRTGAEIRADHHDRIRKSLATHQKRLAAIRDAAKSSEEEVRRWCVDVMRDALGFDDTEIDSEMRSLNQRVDIAVKLDGRVRMIVECKNIRARLKDSVRDQAVGYALNHSAEWAVVTNGQIWKLFHITPRNGREPEVFEVFDIGLLDEDGISEQDIEMMYCISKRAFDSRDIDKAFHWANCCSESSLLSALASERVVKAIRRQLTEAYKEQLGEAVSLEDAEVYELVRDLFLPEEL